MGMRLVVMLSCVVAVQGRSEGLAILDEILAEGSILWDGQDTGEFGMLFGAPVTGTFVKTRNKYPTEPMIFMSILSWTAMPHAARIRSKTQNADQTWTFEVFWGQPWCHSSQPMPYTLNAQWFAFEGNYFNPLAGPGELLEVGLLKDKGGIFTITPQASTVVNVDKINGGDVSILAQVQTYRPAQAQTELNIQTPCTGTCVGGSSDPACVGCNNGGPNPVCLRCDAARQADINNAYDWQQTRVGGSTATDITFFNECARQVNGNGRCDSLKEDIAYAIFRKGLTVHTSPQTGEGYYLWAGVISPVGTGLPGIRVDYATTFPLPHKLAGASVFGCQDAQNGPDPCQPRLGETYPDHLNVMVLEDNCHGSGVIAHANAVLSLVVVVWNATTPTLPYYSSTKSLTQTITTPPTPTLTLTATRTRSVSESPSLSESPTASLTPTPTLRVPTPTPTPSLTLSRTMTPYTYCTIFPTSTACQESPHESINWLPWLLLGLLLCLCCCCLLAFFFYRRRRKPPPRAEKSVVPNALADDYDIKIGASPVGRSPRMVLVPPPPDVRIQRPPPGDTMVRVQAPPPGDTMVRVQQPRTPRSRTDPYDPMGRVQQARTPRSRTTTDPFGQLRAPSPVPLRATSMGRYPAGRHSPGRPPHWDLI